jgi:hypothetical protein
MQCSPWTHGSSRQRGRSREAARNGRATRRRERARTVSGCRRAHGSTGAARMALSDVDLFAVAAVRIVPRSAYRHRAMQNSPSSCGDRSSRCRRWTRSPSVRSRAAAGMSIGVWMDASGDVFAARYQVGEPLSIRTESHPRAAAGHRPDVVLRSVARGRTVACTIAGDGAVRTVPPRATGDDRRAATSGGGGRPSGRGTGARGRGDGSGRGPPAVCETTGRRAGAGARPSCLTGPSSR